MRAACKRPGAAERHQRVVARIAAALGRDELDRAHDVGVGELQGGGGGLLDRRGRSAAASRLRRRAARRRRRASCGRRGTRSAGWCRCTICASVIAGSVPPLAVAGRARDRRRRFAGRPAACRRHRPRRSSRRRRRPRRCRAPACGSAGRRSRFPRRATARPSCTRQTSVEVPPMSKVIRSLKPERAACRVAPTTPAAGPE